MTASKYPERYPQMFHKLMLVLKAGGETRLTFPFPTGKGGLNFIRDLNGFVSACKKAEAQHWRELIAAYDGYFSRCTLEEDPYSKLVKNYKQLSALDSPCFVHILSRDIYAESARNVGSIIEDAFARTLTGQSGFSPVAAETGTDEDPLAAFRKKQQSAD